MPVSVQCPNPDCHASFSIAPGDVPLFRRCPKCGWDLFADAGSGHFSTLAPDPNEASSLGGDRPPPRSAPDPLVGETLAGRYTIFRVLGRGGMGAVYLASDTRLGGRKVAVKVPTMFDEQDAGFLKRLEREAHIAAQFQHPNICPIFDVGTHDGRPFLVLAYIEGTSLADYLDRRTKPFEVVQAVKLVCVVAKAMHEAHETGIIHRDLKPDNIMLTREGRPIVMDFGLAKRADSGEKLTSVGKAFGTPAYMPLEQFQDVGAIDHRADIYSLGVTLYQLLTGQLPYRGTLYQIMGALLKAEPARPPSELREDVVPALEAICLKAMAREAADRYASMRAFAEALALWLKTTTGHESGMERRETTLSGSGSLHGVPAKPPRPESLRPSKLRGEKSDARRAVRPPPPVMRQSGARSRNRRPWALFALVVFSLLLLGIVVYVATDYGKVQITVVHPDAVIWVDGSIIRIEKVGEPTELSLGAGAHELWVARGGVMVETRPFAVTRGGREVVRVEYVTPPAPPTPLATLPPTEKPAPAPAPEKPEAEVATAEPSELPIETAGIAPKPDGLLLRYNPDPERREWERLAAETPLKTQDRILSLKPFRNALLLGGERSKVDLIEETEVWILSARSTEAARLNLAQGRLILHALDTGLPFVIQFAGCNVSITAPRGGIVGVERLSVREVGSDQHSGPILRFYTPDGEVTLVVNDSKQTLTGPVAVSLIIPDGKNSETRPAPSWVKEHWRYGDAMAGITPVPSWVTDAKPSTFDQRVGEQFASHFHPGRPILAAVIEATDHQQAEVRRLAVHALRAVGDISWVVPLLSKPDDPALRKTTISVLRSYLVQGTEAGTTLRNELRNNFGPEGVTTVEKLLFGYTTKEARDKATYDLLVKLLESDQVGIRELALDNLQSLTGRDSLDYDPDKPEGRGLQAWKDLNKKKDLRPPAR